MPLYSAGAIWRWSSACATEVAITLLNEGTVEDRK